jgi:hypothetical protein
MIPDQRDPKRFRRYRDQLLERLYIAAVNERSRLSDHLSGEFLTAVARLEEFDAADSKVAARA